MLKKLSEIVNSDEYSFDLNGKVYDAKVSFITGRKNIELLQLFMQETFEKQKGAESVDELFTTSLESLSVNLDVAIKIINIQFSEPVAQSIIDNASSQQISVIRDIILASWQGITYEELMKQKK